MLSCETIASAILPEMVPPSIDTPSSKVVALKGDTIEAIDDFVVQVRNEINGWGIAGEGLDLAAGPRADRRPRRPASCERSHAAAEKTAGLN